MRHGLTFVPTAVLLALAAAPTAVCRAGDGGAPLSDARIGVRTAPVLLLSRPDVRGELGLSPRQADEAERAVSDFYTRALALRGKTGAQTVRERQAIDDAARSWFMDHLTAEQRIRLVQLDLQWEGPSSLVSRPVVSDTLELTAEQRAAVYQAVAKRNQARGGQAYSPAAEEALARQAFALLTPVQRERWRAMLGRPFAPQIATTREDSTRKR